MTNEITQQLETVELWLELIVMPDIPTGLSNESGTVGLEISNKFDAFKQWAAKRINEI